jgi:hypothetical protein
MFYKVSDEVLLSSRYIRTRRVYKKLNDRFLGPFRIVEVISKNAYKLDLPKQYERIHRIFSIALLEPYHRREGQESPSPIKIEDEEEWLVNNVLDARVSHGKRMFLVR